MRGDGVIVAYVDAMYREKDSKTGYGFLVEKIHRDQKPQTLHSGSKPLQFMNQGSILAELEAVQQVHQFCVEHLSRPPDYIFNDASSVVELLRKEMRIFWLSRNSLKMKKVHQLAKELKYAN